MALSERTRLYEVMIRFAADGTPSTLQRCITEVLRDGEVINATEQLATPIDPAAVAGIIGEGQALLLAENLRIKAELSPSQREKLGMGND